MAGNDSFEGNIYPVKAIKGNKAAVRHIFFDFDKAVLKQKSFKELDRIAKFLLDNPTLEIEVSGHTDSIGDDAYNQKLSEKRAQAVRQYLIEKGVAENRLTASWLWRSLYQYLIICSLLVENSIEGLS